MEWVLLNTSHSCLLELDSLMFELFPIAHILCFRLNIILELMGPGRVMTAIPFFGG